MITRRDDYFVVSSRANTRAIWDYLGERYYPERQMRLVYGVLRRRSPVPDS